MTILTPTTVVSSFAVAALAVAGLAAQDRFDYLVREGFFAGLSGNQERLDRALSTTEAILAEDPEHAEALVWHGMGRTSESLRELQSGDSAAARRLFQEGLAEMTRAVELAPDNIGVRIPRGAVLREASRDMPPDMARLLLERARSDFQHAFDLQSGRLEELGTPHPLGELLQGLGDIYSRQGKVDEAARYYGMILERLPDTEYSRRAAEWMESREPLPQQRSACYGCHTVH